MSELGFCLRDKDFSLPKFLQNNFANNFQFLNVLKFEKIQKKTEKTRFFQTSPYNDAF